MSRPQRVLPSGRRASRLQRTSAIFEALADVTAQKWAPLRADQVMSPARATTR
jgi:hypothetical protein